MLDVGVVVTNALLVDTCCKRVSRQRSTRPKFHRQQTLSDGSASPPAQPISDDARRHVTSSFPATDVCASPSTQTTFVYVYVAENSLQSASWFNFNSNGDHPGIKPTTSQACLPIQ